VTEESEQSESFCAPPCLRVDAFEWVQHLFVTRGYRGVALSGIRRLLAAHCVFHSGCELCRVYLVKEYEGSHLK